MSAAATGDCQPSVVMLFGAPGAGKGTQARRIRERFNLPLISTGDLIRAEVWAETDLGRRMRETLRSGRLVEDSIVNVLVDKAFDDPRNTSGLLLDGYPRTPAQAEHLIRLIGPRGLSVSVVEIQVSYTELKRRVTGRRICPQCGAIFNIHSTPPAREGVCDSCGEGLIRRSDDREEALDVRWEAYDQQTRPVLKVLRENGCSILAVDGTLPPDEVAREVLRGVWRP